MRLNIIAFSFAFGIIWAACILLVSLIEVIRPEYGHAFLELVASIYPGYLPGTGIVSIIIGTAYAFVDGAIGGAAFAWIYNRIANRYPD
jgi:hypothetical protein